MREPARRPARTLSRQIRDAGYLVLVVITVAAAGFGILAAGAILTGSPLGDSSLDSNMSSLSGAHATATAVVHESRALAEAEDRKLVSEARVEAKKILAEARQKSESASASPEPTPTPTIIPGPTPTATIAGAPDLNGLPDSWDLVVFGVQPQLGRFSVVNRADKALSTTIVISYLQQDGTVAVVRRTQVRRIPGRTTIRVNMRPYKGALASYRIRVTHVL